MESARKKRKYEGSYQTSWKATFGGIITESKLGSNYAWCTVCCRDVKVAASGVFTMFVNTWRVSYTSGNLSACRWRRTLHQNARIPATPLREPRWCSAILWQSITCPRSWPITSATSPVRCSLIARSLRSSSARERRRRRSSSVA